uniref:Uncharacterized protein n=1 Tax=Tanacetum cinerariifolium TaxID=118510 RepID=A0A6L2N4Z3_TANCI|nr:hypothetical protein [Tanacetum cinerariifolium]
MDNPGTTMKEYIQYETEKALRNNQVYNWETAKCCKISWSLNTVDIDLLRFVETKFPTIVYDDALKLESDFSSKLALNSKLINNEKKEKQGKQESSEDAWKNYLPNDEGINGDSNATQANKERFKPMDVNDDFWNLDDYLIPYDDPY